MLLNFGNLFITAPRHAEGTDARLDIRKHDPEQDSRRKKGERETAEPVSETNDSATVTVEALRVFLETFLKSMEVKNTDGPTQALNAAPSAENASAAKTNGNIHVDGEAAKAAGVYQHVAQKVDRNASPAMSQDVQAAEILQAEDLRAIYKLLEDLKPLSANGVEYLTIERGDSFLGSLIAAVEKAKNS